jgi:hypothetical protein
MFQNRKIDRYLCYVGICVCIARIALPINYETLIALFLFLAHLNLQRAFTLYKMRTAEKAEQKNRITADKITHLEDEVRKLVLQANFKGVVR